MNLHKRPNRRKSIFLPTILHSLCLLLVVLSLGTIFGIHDDSSSSSSSSLTSVLAFPLASLSSSPLSSTRIYIDLDDTVIEGSSKNAIADQPSKTKPSQRRNFLEQATLAATAIAGSSTISSTKPVYAVDFFDFGRKKAEIPKAITEGNAIVYRKAKGGGLAQAIRVGLRFKMDELQRDLMEERWDLLQPYPAQLRSYVYIFTTYTDAAFPTDSPTDKELRVTLRYEVGRFYGSLERLRKAIAKQALDEAYTAYADMSIHFDRYLHAGGLYTYYDSVVDDTDEVNEVSVKGPETALAYSDPVKEPAEVRDLIVLCRGPDKGKTGILIGIYAPTEKSNDCIVKLDEYRGMREILVVPRAWAAKRLGEQSPDAVFSIPRKEA